MAGSGEGRRAGVMMESEGVRGKEVHVERQQVKGKWPMNLERNVDQEFTEEDNTREKEEREENWMIFLHIPAKRSRRLRESGGNK